MSQTSGRIAKAAGIMVVATLASRVLGLARETAVAAWFGQNGYTDVYRAAFSLPDTLFFLLAGGVFSSAFVPVFTQYYKNEQEEEAWRVFSIIATFMTLVIAALVVVGELFARQLVPLLTPGLSAQQLDLTAQLTRILLPAQLCFFLGGLLMAVLYVRGKFLVPAVGPIVYNLGTIIGAALGHKTVGVAGMCWGALAGAFVGNFLMQALYLRALGMRFTPSLNLRHPGVVKVGKLALPVLLGLSLPQVFVLINRWFASGLEAGTISALDNANKLMQAPLGIFAQAIGIAIFPVMSALAARGQMEDYRQTFTRGLRSMWFLTIPASVLMMVAAPDVVSLVLQYKKFTAADAHVTSVALVCYCTGLFAFASQALLNRAFYSLQDTVTPMVIGTLTTVAFVILNFVMVKPFGYPGLAVAGSLAAMLHVGWMILTLRRKAGVALRPFAGALLKFALAGAAAGAAAYLARWGFLKWAAGAGLPEKLRAMVALGLVGAVGGGIYLALARALRCEEWRDALAMLRRQKKGQGSRV